MNFRKNLKKITYLSAFLLAFFTLPAITNAVGLTVGTSTTILLSNENLYYGITSSSSSTGNFLLFEKGPGNTIFRIDHSGNITSTGNLIGANNYWNLSGSDLYASTTDWRLGIGTTGPTQKLDVRGVITASTGYRVNNALATSGTYLRGNGTNFVASSIQAADVPTLNQNTTGSAYYLNSRDTRLVNDEPDDFNALVKYDFKANSTNGLSDGGLYNGVMTWRHYGTAGDFSGGPAMQLAYTSNGNLWTRTSASSTAWNTWKKILNNDTGVLLQSSTPGTAQAGNINISGNGLFGGKIGVGATSVPNDIFSIANGGAHSPATSTNTGHNYTSTYFSSDKYALANYGLVETLVTNSSYWTRNGNNLYPTTITNNVGIGTNNASSKLQINTDFSSSGLDVKQISSSAGTYNLLKIGADSWDVANRGLRFEAWTDLASYHQYLLYNGYATGTTPTFYQGNYQRFSGIEFAGGNTNFLVNPGASGTGSNTVITPTKALTIDYTGKVGIGTTSPSVNLHVVDNTSNGAKFILESTYAGAGGRADMRFASLQGDVALRFNAESSNGSNYIQSGNYAFNGNKPLYFSGYNGNTGSTLGFNFATTYFSNGNVGIGTVSPQRRLDIYETATTTVANVLGVFNPVAGTSAQSNGASIIMGHSSGNYYNKIATVFESSNPSFLNPALVFYTMNNSYLPGSEVERMRISSNGRVGIGGTTTPNDIFSIANGGVHSPATSTNTGHNYTSTYFSSDKYALANYGLVESLIDTKVPTIISSSSLWGSGSNNIWSLNTGNVGIGTSNPSQKLTVNGNILISPAADSRLIFGSSFTIQSPLSVGASWRRGFIGSNLYWDQASSTWQSVGSGSSDVAGISFSSGGISIIARNGYTQPRTFTTAEIDAMANITFFNNGNVSIPDLGNFSVGTTNPRAKLDVTGAVDLSGDSGLAAAVFGSSYNHWTYFGGTTGGRIRGASGEGYLIMEAFPTGTQNDLIFRTGGDERMRVKSTGNVGIGITNPTNAKLQVVGNIATNLGGKISPVATDIGAANIEYDVSISEARFKFNGYYGHRFDTQGGTRMIISQSGKVGVGAATIPNDIFSIANGGSHSPATSTNTGHNYTSTYFSSDKYALANYGLVETLVSNAVSPITLWGGTTSGNIWSLNSGNVGIGVTSPAHKLELVASTTAAGGIGFGTDTELYRSAANTLALASGDSLNLVSGNLQVAGTNVITSSRLILGSNGTVSAPTFSFSADTNTGMYRGGTDILRFSTAGADRMTILANGNVGIGTTNPDAKLNIFGTVGSGSLSPQEDLLHIGGNELGGAGGYAGLKIGGTQVGTYSTYIRSIKTGAYGSVWNSDLAFSVTRAGTTNTIDEVMRLTSGGNVGIGTTSPASKLTVISSSPAAPYSGIGLYSNGATSYTAYTIGRTGVDGYFAVAGGANHYLTGSAASDVMINAVSGKVLIGTGSIPGTIGLAVTNGKVAVGGGAIPYDVFSIANTGGLHSLATSTNTGHNYTQTYFSSDKYALANYGLVETLINSSVPTIIASSSLWGAGSNNIWSLNTGNVGIGTASPESELHVKNSATTGYISYEGNIAIGRSGSQSTQALFGRFQNAGDTASGNSYYTYIGNNAKHVVGSNYLTYYKGNGYIIPSVISFGGDGKISFLTSQVAGENNHNVNVTLAERMSISQGGLVGIGVGSTAPNARLQVKGGSSVAAPSTVTDSNLSVGTGDFGVYIRQMGAVNGISGITWANQIIGRDGNAFEIYSLGGQPLVLGTNSTERMRIDSSGRVGISAGNPAAKLTINQGGYNWPPTSGTTPTGGFRIQAEGGGNVVLDMGVNGGAGAWIQTTNRSDLAAKYPLMLNPNGGNVGVGATSTPYDIFSIANGGYYAPSGVSNTGHNFTSTYLSSDPYALVNYGILNTLLDDELGSYLPLAGGTMVASSSINMNNGTITALDTLSVRKINAVTIDPLYTINGTNYSTFAPSVAGGVKEEFVGKAEIKRKKGTEYEYKIDFNLEKEGTDLWVWRKTVDYSDDNVQVLVTPSGSFAKVYYVIEGNNLIFRSDRPVKVSYRLVGNRFDWREWPTKALDQIEQGLIVR